MMRPLIDERLYERLVECRHRMIDGKVGRPANVFVPVGASDPGSPPGVPRVLYVGRATRDFGASHLDGFSGAAAGASRVVDEWFMRGGSGFWQFIRAILKRIAEDCGQPGEALPARLAWSNLAKIGNLTGNPGGRSLREQQELCIEALTMEIEAFKPTAILIATTNYAEKEVVFPLFGDEGWSFDTPEEDRIAYKQHPTFGLIAYTNHPQGMRPAGTRSAVQEFVADLIMMQWRGQPLPPSMRSGPAGGT